MAGARDAALRALIAFRRDGAWPESALKDALRGMDRREAALATRLCNGVLQNRMLLDHWLSDFVRGKLQPSCAISCGWPPISSAFWIESRPRLR